MRVFLILAVTAVAVAAAEAAPQEVLENNQLAEQEAEVFASAGRLFTCPSGWVRSRNSCYKYVSFTRSWSNAVSNCAGMGASLASAHDAFEYRFLQELTRKSGSSTTAWIGGFYFQGWRWVDQSPFCYSYWNSQNSFTSFPCIYLNTRVGWSNSYCSTSRPYICVKRSDDC